MKIMNFRYIRNFLIKFLGGYTQNEYKRIEMKYQTLIDTKTQDNTSQICNEYMYRLLRDLTLYAKNVLYYEKDANKWADKMYNILHGNMMVILMGYVQQPSSTIYKINTTLTSKMDALNYLKSIINSLQKNKQLSEQLNNNYEETEELVDIKSLLMDVD